MLSIMVSAVSLFLAFWSCARGRRDRVGVYNCLYRITCFLKHRAENAVMMLSDHPKALHETLRSGSRGYDHPSSPSSRTCLSLRL
jgi:hypothetical protein